MAMNILKGLIGKSGDSILLSGDLVVNADTSETYSAHSADSGKHLTAAEKAALQHLKQIQVVDDIAARDAIAEPFEGLSAYVKDATADMTVKKGGAYYIYDGTEWIKTAEAESMDLTASVTENELADLNAKKHTHTNAASLDKLTVDADGLKVDGVGVGGIAFVANAGDTPVFGDKLVMVLESYTLPVA